MLISDNVYVTLCSKNINYYKDKGYSLEQFLVKRGNIDRIPRGTQLLVNINDLPDNSTVNIIVRCDYCGKEFSKQYREYINSNQKGIIKTDCCNDNVCLVKKRTESNLLIYGVENVFQVKEYQEKQKETLKDKYNVNHVSHIEGHNEKVINTSLERYGVKHYNQTDECKEKIEITSLEKYGETHFSKTLEFKNKVIQTCIDKYGVNSVMHVDIFKNKCCESLLKAKYKNGTGVSSKQQKYLYQLLGGELNYPVNNLMLDIAFPKSKIYIEYDGGGHDLRVKCGDLTKDEFLKKEINRYYFLKNKGWKLIRLISKKDYLPNDKTIKEIYEYSIDYLKQDHSWIKFNIDENYFENSIGVTKINFGNLQKIF